MVKLNRKRNWKDALIWAVVLIFMVLAIVMYFLYAKACSDAGGEMIEDGTYRTECTTTGNLTTCQQYPNYTCSKDI